MQLAIPAASSSCNLHDVADCFDQMLTSNSSSSTPSEMMMKNLLSTANWAYAWDATMVVFQAKILLSGHWATACRHGEVSRHEESRLPSWSKTQRERYAASITVRRTRPLMGWIKAICEPKRSCLIPNTYERTSPVMFDLTLNDRMMVSINMAACTS
jgi:hypothetical protein